MPNIQTLEYTNSTTHQNDKGPANEQTDLGDIDGVTHSSVLLPDETFNLRDQVQNIVNEIVGDNHEEVTVNSRGTVTIRWPTHLEMFLFQNLLHLTFSLWHFHVCFLMVQVISMSIDIELVIL
jgi:hypothetical protein